jgi:hypothetical protein
MTSKELTGFRLVLSDDQLGGGQRIKTVKDLSAASCSIEKVVALLAEHLGLQDLCRQRGLDVKKLGAGGALQIAGLDGPRRVPIQSDADLTAFLNNLQHTCLPSLEAQLAGGAGAAADASGPPAKRGREPRDRVEELEDEKFKLMRATDRTDRRVDDLERLVTGNVEEGKTLVERAKREFQKVLEETTKSLQGQLDGLRLADAEALKQIDVVRKQVESFDKGDKKQLNEINHALADFRQNVEAQLDDVSTELEDLRGEDERLKADAQELRKGQEDGFNASKAELARIEALVEGFRTSKVDAAHFEKHHDELGKRMSKEVAGHVENLGRHRMEVESMLRAEAEERAKQDAALDSGLRQAWDRLNGELQTLMGAIETGLQKASEDLEGLGAGLRKERDTRFNNVTDSTTKMLEELKQELEVATAATAKKTDVLTKKTETTFQALNERLEEMVRVERTRLGTIERNLADTNIKIRSDCRADLERVRTDYEQDLARLDADLGDLHMKHDITKQELNFCQSRLTENKEWAHGKLTELTTATKSVQVDTQEGLAAATKMLNALRDDAVGFREKMAKYISLLQQSSDSQGDAVHALEAHRTRMRVEIDALIGDHKAYTNDMDGWADDVRLKVERLFRALEPQKVEWRIMRAAQRAKELKKPLPVKSPAFALKGLKEVYFEFYPDGHNSSPEGKAVLRAYLPPSAHVRFQSWVGRFPCGNYEWRPGGNNLWVDFPVDKWKDHINDDGTISISMEVLWDHKNTDESLAREVRIESP